MVHSVLVHFCKGTMAIALLGSVAGGCGTSDGRPPPLVRDSFGGRDGSTVEGDAPVHPAEAGSEEFRFDPAAIYLRGPLEPDVHDREAIASVLDPNVHAVGFGPGIAGAQLRIRKGKLLYHEDADFIREFVPDAVYVRIDTPHYPADPKGNDPTLPVRCPVDGSRLVTPGFVHTNADGRIIYTCTDGWHDGDSGSLLYKFDFLSAFAADDLVMTVYPNGVMSLRDQVVHEVALSEIVAIRGHGAGFHVVDGVGGAEVLWALDAMGNQTNLGSYGPLPEEWLSSEGMGVLDANDVLYQIAGGVPPMTSLPVDVIVRRTLAGPSTIVYSDADGHPVKIHQGQLFSGS